jgi:hypothetical protein
MIASHQHWMSFTLAEPLRSFKMGWARIEAALMRRTVMIWKRILIGAGYRVKKLI